MAEPEREPDWPFDQPPNTASITVRAVLEGAPILIVSHDADDGGWQFLDGNEVDEAEGRIIGLGTALRLDPTLRGVANLPEGWIASRRDAASPWSRERSE